MTSNSVVTFSDQEEFDQMAAQTFYTQTEETIMGLGASSQGYIDALTKASHKDIPLEYPYVFTSLVDFYYLGYCAFVDLEAIRTLLVQRGEAKQDNNKEKFILIIWIKVRYSTSRLESEFSDLPFFYFLCIFFN